MYTLMPQKGKRMEEEYLPRFPGNSKQYFYMKIGRYMLETWLKIS